MRFYQSSTVRQCIVLKPNPITTAPSISTYPPTQTQTGTNLYNFYFGLYLSEFLQISNQLNQELLKNNNLINLRKSSLPNKMGEVRKDSENNSTTTGKNTSQCCFEGKNNQNEQESKPPSNKHKRKKKYESESEESYRPDADFQNQQPLSKVSESKNIPKNYGKAIVNFIRRNQAFTQNVLAHLDIDPQHFMQQLQSVRLNLNTISELRAMWTPGQNKYAKAFRIFSTEYLRKHSLGYIFNSRVYNFHKHIKYRYKIIQSVAEPETFTCMKEF